MVACGARAAEEIGCAGAPPSLSATNARKCRLVLSRGWSPRCCSSGWRFSRP